MDKFVKIKNKNNLNLFGRETIYYSLLEYIKRLDTICLYGPSGIGKTFLVNQFNLVEFPNDIIKSKNDTVNFLEKIGKSRTILVDDVDTESVGWKEIVERVKDHSFLIVVQKIYKIDFCDCIQLEPYSPEHMIEISGHPECSLEKVKKFNGNVREFLLSFDFDGERDIFNSPKDTVHNLLCPCDTNPSEWLGRIIEDHGYSWGIVHENYRDLDNIPECMSLADIYDHRIYMGDWDMIKYFCHEAVIRPAIHNKQSLCRETMRPGSAWTKFNNMKMRHNKILDIQRRQKTWMIDVDSLRFLHLFRDIDQLKHYGITSSDMDIINHLTFGNKLKAKDLMKVKKKLRDGSQ
jgi:hypothetical protein